NFALPKFLYLIGHDLIQPANVKQTLALIEVANRYDMKAVKQVVKTLGEGASLAEALKPYPVLLPETAIDGGEKVTAWEMKPGAHKPGLSQAESFVTRLNSKSGSPAAAISMAD